jgi:hypothetical protein
MPSNIVAAAIGHNDRRGGGGRLPVRMAALGIGVLSFVGWAAVLLPVIALLHR